MIFLTQALMVLLLWSPMQLAFADKDLNKDMNDKMICQVNKFRSSQGLPPLGTIDSLLLAAQDQAEYQAEVGKMQHEGPDGKNVAARATKHGFNWNDIAEIVSFCDYTDSNACLKTWLDSPAHRAILLSGAELAAVAKAPGKENPNMFYYSMVFGTDSEGRRGIPSCGTDE